MYRLAWMFPGQGAQTVGMAAEAVRVSPAARRVFDEADEALGWRLSDLILNGPEERLRETEVTQPALLTASLAVLAALRDQLPEPVVSLGLSLGEYTALVAAGGLELADAVRIVHRRGRFMQEAVPIGEGAMAAVLGLEAPVVEAVTGEVARRTGGVVEPANYNCPGQIVIAGDARSVADALEALKARGARRALPLPVSAPFHCRLMRPAADRLAEALQGVSIRRPRWPIVANATAEPVTEPARIRELLIAQVASSVRFEQSLRRVAELGADTFLEIGPGTALAGFVRRALPDARAASVEDPAAWPALAAAWLEVNA